MSQHVSGQAHIPVTKGARQQRIIELLETGQVRSQTDIRILAAEAPPVPGPA